MKVHAITIGLGRRIVWPDDFFIYQTHYFTTIMTYLILDNHLASIQALQTP